MTNITSLVKELKARVDGERPADLRITGAAAVADVMNGVWRKNTDVLIRDGLVYAVVPAGEGEAREAVDVAGGFVLPAFIDSHVHIESSMLTPSRFSDLAVPQGTGTVVADPHEIANVLGTAGLDFMMADAAGAPLNIRWMLPSCVPSTPFETAGARLSAADLAPYMAREDVLGLGEVMNVPGVLAGDEDLLAKLALAKSCGKVADGHAPMLSGAALARYAAAGVSSDHECSTPEELADRIAAGMTVNLREGSAAKNVKALLRAVTPENAIRCFFCNDDAHAEDVRRFGHIQKHLRIAVAEGLPAMTAVRMATVNAAAHYGIHDAGALVPGRRADVTVVDNLTDFNVTKVFLKGRFVAEEGRLLAPATPIPVPFQAQRTVNIAPVTVATFAVPLRSGRARLIGMEAGEILTQSLVRPVATKDGFFDAALNPGLVKLAVVERHHAYPQAGLGILAGYARRETAFPGAVAVTVAHDSHNLIIAGGRDEDMVAAAQRIAKMGGGLCAVKEGRVVAELPLPVAGLMSDRSVDDFIAAQTAFNRALRDAFDFAPGIDPVETLSFMALPVIPTLRVTDKGLFDASLGVFVPVDVED